MVSLRWTKWPQKLNIEKTFKRHFLLGQLPDFKIISQKKVSWETLYQNCYNGSALLNKMAAKAKNKKYKKKKKTLNDIF